MSLISIPWQPSSKDLRIFAGLQVVLFLIVAGSVGWRHGHVTAALLILAGSALLAVVGLIVPRWVRPIYVGWMVMVFPIGWVVSHLILAIAYFLVITPIGLALRLSGHDPLERRPDPRESSYWRERPPPPETARYFRQF